MDITRLYQNKEIEAIDWAFADLMRRLSHNTDPWVDLACALVSQATENGHACLDMAAAHCREGVQESGTQTAIPMEIDLDDWCARVAACPTVGMPGDFRPLIMADRRLYLHRYWTYEHHVAQFIQQRSLTGATDPESRVVEMVRRLFSKKDGGQRRAAYMAATRAFVVICGGPGTGKTYTLARIILLLQYLSADKPLRIKLCAPTGKAAARLQEAMEAAVKQVPGNQTRDLSNLGKARTIHRMLEPIPASRAFRYHAGRPLPADVVIVDEASMIDLALMAKLMQAMAPGARLILSGDKDQLASVEAGAVLGDICHGAADQETGKDSDTQAVGPADPPTALRDQIVVLHERYRFEDASGIGALGQAVNSGNVARTLEILSHGELPDLALRTFATWEQLIAALEQEVLQNSRGLGTGSDPRQALSHLKRLQILTVLRKGPYGAQVLNAQVEKVLGLNGLIVRSPQDPSGWYSGRPVMILRNDYHLGLFNGDMGIAMAQDATPTAAGRLAVFFPGDQGALNSFAPYQLPPHETAYAMTVHKSQGSEFDRVILILPDRDVPVLTRELIYTAITRARQSVTIWGDAQLLGMGVQRRIERASGLRQALWGSR